MSDIIYDLRPEQTALIVIDMQNGFCSFDGSISQGGGDVTAQNAVIPKVRELVEACRGVGILDIWTLQNHYADDVTKLRHRITPHTMRWAKGANPTAVQGTWDADIVDELKDLAQGPAEMVTKHRFSGFLDTRLHTLLRMKGIDTIVVCGVATTHCVETTVRDAYQRDYDVVVASDSVAAMSASAHDASLDLIDKYFGVVLPQDTVIDLIKGDRKVLNMNQGWVDRTAS